MTLPCRASLALVLGVLLCLAEDPRTQLGCQCLRETVDVKTSFHCNGTDAAVELLKCLRTLAPEYVVQGISLTGDSSEVLDMEHWKLLPTLESLSLTGCHFIDLRLGNMSGLTTLNLVSNGLRELKSEWFSSMSGLQLLNLSSNHLHSLPEGLATKLPHLVLLDVSHNNLSDPELSWLGSWPFLMHVDLSHNALGQLGSPTGLPWNDTLPNLRYLDVSWNQLKSICTHCLGSQPKLSTLRLDHNRLHSLPDLSNNTQLVVLYLAGNPWHCDEQLASQRQTWLKSLSSNPDKHRPSLEVQDSSEVVCTSPPQWQGQGLFLFGFDLCVTCQCNVLVSLSVEVNCTQRGLQELPTVLPLGTKVLMLAGNHIQSLDIPANSVNWEKLLMLDVHDNEVPSADPVANRRYLATLMGLNLAGNQLTGLPLHLLKQLGERSMDDLRLGNNPWTCDCNMADFPLWLQENKKVRDVEDIRCCDVSSGRLAGQAIYRLLKSDLCPQPTNWTNVMLDALNGIMAFLILAIVAKLLRDYWRQKRTGKLPTFFGFV